MGLTTRLFGGSKVSDRLDATLTLRTDSGRAEYRFALAHAHPDRFMFVDEAFRFNYGVIDPASDWIHVGSGHTEANILETARSAGPDGHTAGDVLVLLRRCEVYQFHDTSDDSRLKKRWDVDDNAELRAHGGNLAAVLHGLEARAPGPTSEKEDSRPSVASMLFGMWMSL